MKKLFSALFFIAAFYSIGIAQEPARSAPVTCVRDDATSTVVQAEGQQTPCRTDANGRLYTNGSETTQPISAASLPLPTGAATSALQDGIIKDGTGDTTEANVSSGRLHVDGSGVTQPISAASLPLPTGAATAALQDGIIKDGTGDTTEANVSSGRLHVDGSGVTQPISAASLPLPSGAATAAKQPALGTAGTPSADVITIQGVTSMTAVKVDGSAVTQPVSGTVTANAGTGTFAVNVSQINGTTPSMGNGASGTGVQRVTIANDSTGVVQMVPGTTGGTSTCYLSSAASTNSTNCKASAGQVYGFQVINTTSSIYYLRMYNSASAPTCSSATGFVRTIPIPHASGAGSGVGFSQTVGSAYGTGIGFCLTGGGSSTDNTNAATGVYISILYK